MHATPATAAQANVIGIISLVFVGLLIVATMAGAGLALAGRPGSGLRRVGLGISVPCGSLLAGLFLLAIPVLFMIRTTTHWDRPIPAAPALQTKLELSKQSSPAPQLPNPLPASNSPQTTPQPLSNLTPHEDRTVADESTVKKPDWITQPISNTGDVVHAALSSQQYATVEEARNELARQVRTGLIKDFERVYGVKFSGINNLPLETLKGIAVRQEYVETVQRDFGSFFAPMHRVWWQFEVSPEVRTRLHGMWKASAQESRTLIVGGSLIAATLGFAGLSLLSRRKKAVPATPAPKDSSGVVLGVGAATLMAQRCKRWWRS